MTDTPPLVSVIIPAYRRADFVNQAVAGILQQTFTDYEIIVVDDASGEDVVRQYQLPAAAILIRRTVNSGSAAIPRNDGFRAARGKYLAFLDMDDLWLPEKLASQVAVLDAQPEVGVAFCHYTLVDEALNPESRQAQAPKIGADALAQMIAGNFIRSPSQALIRRSVMEAEGAFDETIVGTSDWSLWLHLTRSSRFAGDPAPLVLYRRHKGQQSKDMRRMRRGGIIVLEKEREWIARERPGLLPLLQHHLAQRYYVYAKAQMRLGDDVSAVYRTLHTAVVCSPATLRTYQGFARLACYAIGQKLGRKLSV
ncbi:MAG: glycosyltransferase family 2 protein [Armatimonadota bacterium]